jgi:hypothetical protein
LSYNNLQSNHMKGEVKEKDQKRTVSVTIPDVPMSVHNKIKLYRRKIMVDHNKDYGMMAAYNEALKEFAKNLTV